MRWNSSPGWRAVARSIMAPERSTPTPSDGSSEAGGRLVRTWRAQRAGSFRRGSCEPCRTLRAAASVVEVPLHGALEADAEGRRRREAELAGGARGVERAPRDRKSVV